MIKGFYLEISVFIIVIFLGIIHLTYPFFGDQALFTVAAKKMANGGILYKDFWDFKQPGIFVFFYIAGFFFKFSDVGIHLFELVYWLIFTFLVVKLFHKIRLFDNAIFNTILPLFIVGVYYSNVGITHLTQVEALVNFPILFLFWILAYVGNGTGKNYHFFLLLMSGILVAVILIFKLIFLPIIVSLYLVFFIRTLYHQPISKSIIYLISIAFGIILILGPLLVYYYQNNLLNTVYNNFFILPTKVIKISSAVDPMKLFGSIFWYIKFNFIIVVLCIIGLFNLGKFTPYILLWLTSVCVVILMQRTSWWSYHFQLLYAPVGIGAAKGAEYLWLKFNPLVKNLVYFRNYKVTFFTFIVFVFLIQVLYVAKKTVRFSNNGFAISTTDKHRHQAEIDPTLERKIAEVDFLKSENSKAGPIFVCGDPVFYTLSGRDQAIHLHGWSLQFFVAEQWDLFYDEMKASNTPYIFISNSYTKYIEGNCPRMIELISDRYNIYKKTDLGLWYVIN